MRSGQADNAPHWVFWIIGAALIVVAILTSLIVGQVWGLISSISLNIGITVVAVSIIDWIWRRVGGDPLMNAITELRNATTLLTDLRDTGLRRLLMSREDAGELRKYIKSKMAQAYEVDMMGIALRSGWVSDPDFQRLIEKRAASGDTHFRIMVFDPKASVTAQRAFEEDRGKSGRISETVGETLRILLQIKNRLPADKRDCLVIKVIDETNIYCSVIRADDLMLVTNYLLHLSGGNSETLEIEGEDTTLFTLYNDEFKATWERAAGWPKEAA